MQLPLFPLSSVVMPGGLLPLRIFEPRYLDMVRDCFRDSSGFGVCAILSGSEVGKPAQTFSSGCEVEIVDWDQDDRGLLTIMALGTRKFRIVSSSVNNAGLMTGEVSWLTPETALPVPAHLAHLQHTLRQILEQTRSVIEYENPGYEDALWVGSRFTELLPLPPRVKNQLLEMDQPVERLETINELLIALTTQSSHDHEA